MMVDEKKPGGTNKYVGWAVKRLALLLFDGLAAYFSYYLALVIRFTTANQFRPIANEYLPSFYAFAPWYTLICLGVFVVFRLYDSRWKHAGLNDLNRIFFANLVTAAVQVVGSLIFTRRMPVTYYLLGAAIQFILIAASRFAYRLVTLEGARLGKRGQTHINVMIVGAGETGRVVRRQIEHDPNNAARPVCVFSHRDSNSGTLLDGIPVVSGMERMPDYLKKYGVQCVILADSIMPSETRVQIKQICKDAGVEVQDFSGYLTNEGRSVTLQKLMEYTSGPVEIMLDGKTQDFANGEQALMANPGKYTVKRIYASKGKVGVEIIRKTVILNDTNEDWVKDTERETGNEISFF
ncbi:MAG: nucleoside-diphosphate sugar epimerase/dehydratase [Aristaeellaceae bacterium]